MKKAVALGTFDGIHKGHLSVLEAAKNYDLTVLTFKYPPKAFFQDNFDLLMMPSDKEKLLLDLGAKRVECLDFPSVKDVEPTEFLKNIKKNCNPDLIVCGFNYRFGKNADGDIKLLQDFCNKNNITFKAVEPIKIDGSAICSTKIRDLIADGQMEKATKLILGGFGFTSEVLHGDKRGRTIGFPTVNQEYPDILVTPRLGVYKGTMIIDGKEHKCITNIGCRPTFKTNKIICESYILDFDKEIYGSFVTLKPSVFLRSEKKFSDIEELKNAIKNDLRKI